MLLKRPKSESFQAEEHQVQLKAEVGDDVDFFLNIVRFKAEPKKIH